MKQALKKYLSLIALCSTVGFVGTATTTDIRIRSQSVDTARELAGWSNQVNLFEMNCMYGTFAITPEYTQSFNGRQIARSLFGSAIINTSNNDCNDNCNNDKNGASFRISGSQNLNRQAGDLLADYFGLPLDYQSTVYVKPKIQNFLVDFDFFIGLDQWLCGLWFRIHAPVVYAKWKLCLNEEIADAGTTLGGSYPAGYFAPAAVANTDLNTSFVSYLQGNVPTLNGGVTFEPLKYGKLCGGTINTDVASNGCCEKSCNNGAHTTKLSDIRAALGWNFWQDEDYHIGVGLLVAAPTGNKVNDTYLFQPFVGNGHHWELGAKFTSHYTFWRSCDYDKSWGIYVDADVTTLLKAKQFRVFDLCSAGDNSKYMLAESLKTPSVDLYGATGAGPVASTYQFDGIFTPVANIAAQQVKVSQDIQVDLTAMLNYTNCGFAWDFGYNFWMTSCERITPCGNNVPLFQGNHVYALKGDAAVYGFGVTVPVALGATESMATICSGTNYPVGTFTPFPTANTNIDNAALGDFSPTGPELFTVPGGAVQTSTSIQSVFLANDNIDYAGARAQGLSNKIFTHISYTWEDRECYVPYFGVGGKAEFANNKKGCGDDDVMPCANSAGCSLNNSSCSSCGDSGCRKTNISEWGIWLKGGVSFN